MKTKFVRQMNVRCSLVTAEGTEVQRTRGGFAASDTCQGVATTAVEMESGSRMYRCKEHKGIRRIEYGPIHEVVRVENES